MIAIDNYASGSSGNCYIVRNEETTILLECGVDKDTLINNILYKNNNRMTLSKLDGCLITHCHSDHMGTKIGNGNYPTLKTINSYTSVYACEEVYEKYHFKGAVLQDKINFKIKTITIKPIAVRHGKTENMAFIFKDEDSKVFFGTDFTNFINADLSTFKFNSIYIEINYITSKLQTLLDKYENEESEEYDLQKGYKYLRQLNTHMSLENCCEFILSKFNLSKCTKIVALHVSKEVGDTNVIKEEVERNFGIPCYIANWTGGYL